MCLSLAGAAIHYYDGALVGNGGMVLSVLSFVACFARSVGADVWVFFSEIFPNQVKRIGTRILFGLARKCFHRAALPDGTCNIRWRRSVHVLHHP